MAMNVNFLKGLYSKYVGLESKDSNTFYLTYESGTNEAMGGAIRLFLGTEELTNRVDLTALREYIGTLPEGATSEDVVSYISEAITAKIGELKIGDTSYDTVVDYVIAKTTGIATDSVVQGKADKVVPAVVNNIAVLTAEGNLSDGGKTIAEVEQAAKDYTDDEITGLELVLSDDGKTLNLNNKDGNTIATLDTTEFVVDGFLTRAEADQAKNTLTFYWNTDSGEQSTEIALDSIADIYNGSAGAEIKVDVSNENVISATLTDTVKVDIANGVTAYGWGNHADAGYMTIDAHNAFVSGNSVLQSGITADKVSGYDTVVTTVNTNKSTWDKAGTAVQSVETGSANGTIAVDGTDVAVFGLGTAAYTNSDAYDAKDTAKNLIGTQQTEETAATGVYAAIQGATTNTVRQCVDAINAMNNQTGVVIGTVENIVTQLTWGSF